MSTAKKSTPKRDLDSFRATFDKSVIIPRAIEAALKNLGASWEPEAEFIKRVGVAPIDFAKYRDQFEDYFAVVRLAGRSPQRVWAGDKAYAEKMRGYANGNG